MESASESYSATLQVLHFYVMWFSVLCTVSCLIKDTTCHLFRPNSVKFLIFAFMLFSGFSWATNLASLRNFPEINESLSDLELLKVKYALSKLQRDVYLEGIETFCLLMLLVVPRYQQYYEDTLKAFSRRVKELSSKSE